MVQGAPVNVLDFGADPTGVADNVAAFNAAQASLQPLGGTVYIPPGTYKMSSTFTVGASISLLGANLGDAYFEPYTYAASKLVFSGSSTGVIIYHNWTSVKNIAILAIAKIGSFNGLEIQWRGYVENVTVAGFSGDGCNIVATGPSRNANLWRVSNSKFNDNGGNGFYVQGGDSNAGIGSGISCERNNGWGIWDSSFLGNTYIGCHVAGNLGGAYKSDGASAANIFLGCYSEGDGTPKSFIAAPALVIGGLHGAGFTTTSTGAITGTRYGKFTGNGLSSSVLDTALIENLTTLAGDANNGDILSSSYGTSGTWRLKFLDAASGNVQFDNDNVTRCYVITGPNTAAKFGRSITVPAAFVPTGGLFLGDGGESTTRQVTSRTSIPTTGTWAQGDVVFNISAASGQPAGWMCTVSGTLPTTGTFKAMANLA